MEGAMEGETVREVTLEDGRIRTCRTLPVRSADGARIGRLWIGIDVTGPRLASRHLLQAKEVAEAASRAKAEFLATISHALRPPMNGVLGNLALLADGDLAGEDRRLAMVAGQSAESLLRLLDDILDLPKLEARRFELEESDCTPADIVATVLEVMRPRAVEKGLVLTSRVLPTVPDVVVTDPARLRQILFNLVGNAVKFTHAGHVAVRARRGCDLDDERFLLEFEVEDTGIGITADAVPALFERFTQADSAITRRCGGTGLGLAICQELCRALGGTIEVDTAPGRGSVFRFSVATRLGDPEALLRTRPDPAAEGRRPEVPVIALTARASGSSRPECLDVGMNGFVAKPLRPGALFREKAAVLGASVAGADPAPVCRLPAFQARRRTDRSTWN